MTRRFVSVLLCCFLGCGLAACVRGETRQESEQIAAPSHETQAEGSSDPAPESPRDVADPGHDPLLLIGDPEVLVALEQDGLSLAGLVSTNADAQALADYGDGPLRAIEASLRARLDRDRAEDPQRTGVGLRYVHRQFDLRWLSAADTRFELIGVVNRMDREVFAPQQGEVHNYGETRLIYRLAYSRTQQGMKVESRLPMTINVVYWQRADPGQASLGRRAIQRRWQADPKLEGAELAGWLRAEGQPLAAARLEPSLLKSVEIDVQTERWPATIRPDMAGHAEYLLQVFHREGEGWVAAPLENTPDVEALQRDKQARAALLAWLRDPAQREAMDRGTLVTPERFLATSATSVTPRSLARRANRPWSRLFDKEDFADFDFEGMKTIRSPAALLRRLDGLSCQGCHESRSIAGFHLLGAERDPDKRVDALQVFTSPHLEGELERRRAWHQALRDGDATPSERRMLSEHERGRGAWGTHCGLGDPGFADWICDEGLECRALADPEIGTCLESGKGLAGGVCEVGTIKARDDWHEDRVRKLERLRCSGNAVCNENAVGFPDGMCTFSCGAKAAGPDTGCGVIPNLRSFNDCLSAHRPFGECIVETSNPAGMRACTVHEPCRDDYICARSGSDEGVCLPPYFLFQLRVDGHPKSNAR